MEDPHEWTANTVKYCRALSASELHISSLPYFLLFLDFSCFFQLAFFNGCCHVLLSGLRYLHLYFEFASFYPLVPLVFPVLFFSEEATILLVRFCVKPTINYYGGLSTRGISVIFGNVFAFFCLFSSSSMVLQPW